MTTKLANGASTHDQITKSRLSNGHQANSFHQKRGWPTICSDLKVIWEMSDKFEDMTVNLVSSGKKSRFFKLGLTVAVTQEADVSVMESLSPRVMDNVTQYLRELKPEEMAGSANFHRVHKKVLLRVRTAVAPIIVTDALITMALVQ